MPSALQHIPDATTVAASATVFFAAIAAAVVGALSAAKKIKEAVLDSHKSDVTVTKTAVIGGMMQDAFGHEVTQAIEGNTFAMAENRREMRDLNTAVCALRDELREQRTEMREHRHAIDRWIDRMDRRHD